MDEEVVFSAIRNLHRDKRVVIQADRGKWYISLESGLVIFDSKFAPAEEIIETGEGEIPEGREKPKGKKQEK